MEEIEKGKPVFIIGRLNLNTPTIAVLPFEVFAGVCTNITTEQGT